MNIEKQNEKAWNKQVENQTTYTQPVSTYEIELARKGEWEIIVSAKRPVPRSWFPAEMSGVKILCLASGGGQQGPILTAAGADVTVVDTLENQLRQDRWVADRDNLELKTIKASMTDLSFSEDDYFDFIINPVSNLFIENLKPYWEEMFRVLKKGGTLITGLTNPVLFIFDDEEDKKGNLVVANSIPYSSLDQKSETEVQSYLNSTETIEFGHTLEDLIQGQFDVGFIMNGFYEDDFGGRRPLDDYLKCFIVTKSIKI